MKPKGTKNANAGPASSSEENKRKQGPYNLVLYPSTGE